MNSASNPASFRLRQLIAFVFFILAWTLPIMSAEAVVFKIATIAPDGAMWMLKMRAGAEKIAERTDNRVKLKFYPGGVMGSDQAVLRKMRVGQLQGGAFGVGSLARIYPDLQIYALPYFFRSMDEVACVRSHMDKQLVEGFEQRGFVSFGFAGGGFAYAMSDHPLQSMDDFKPRKVWAPEGDIISHTVYSTGGVTPVSLPVSDVMTALQTGIVDSLTTTAVGAIAFQWHSKLAYMTDLPLVYIYALLAIDRKAFNKMQPEDQAIVREVLGQVFKEMDQQDRVDNDNARQALQQQGIQLVAVPPEKSKEWEEIAKKATERIQAESKMSDQALSDIKKHLKTCQGATNGY